ncbi:MAG: hypothetical protein MUC60_02135 [Oscillatoria sp. Prado101]|nr:hypothetical protein [Oscillatoria sp. Prado101]
MPTPSLSSSTGGTPVAVFADLRVAAGKAYPIALRLERTQFHKVNTRI